MIVTSSDVKAPATNDDAPLFTVDAPVTVDCAEDIVVADAVVTSVIPVCASANSWQSDKMTRTTVSLTAETFIFFLL
jgi:hypothetical protein